MILIMWSYEDTSVYVGVSHHVTQSRISRKSHLFKCHAHRYYRLIDSCSHRNGSHETDTWYLTCVLFDKSVGSLSRPYIREWGSRCLWMQCYACRYVGTRVKWQNSMDAEEWPTIWTSFSYVWAIKSLDSMQDYAHRQTAQSLNVLLFADHGTRL